MFFINLNSSGEPKSTNFAGMETWVLYALISMAFAGLTSVLAKFGMGELPSDLALVIRTSVVFSLVLANAIIIHPIKQLAAVSYKSLIFLALSGLTTALSWIFYYRAIQSGKVSVVATIDKGSIPVTIFLSAVFLHEQITIRTLLAILLVMAGLILLIKT
jgi:transporter family protein